MIAAPTVRLSELTRTARRLALVGLAKNTGKTVALTALLGELQQQGRAVGVTSVGRDGEEHDVIDARIEKPRVALAAGSLLATTDELLRASGLPYELLSATEARTPLGRVLVVRLEGAGIVEVAGPSASQQVRAVSEVMLDGGAEQVLIDGAIDRRAASAPEVCDGLVMATGAVLGSELEQVVTRTAEAVELARLPLLDGGNEAAGRARSLAEGHGGHLSALIAADGAVQELPARFALRADGAALASLLPERAAGSYLLIGGALPEGLLEALVELRRRHRELPVVIVHDPTRVFLTGHGVGWYRRQGIEILATRSAPLLALTVNPVAPRSHSFESHLLREGLARALGDLPVLDVCAPDYP
ncbi:MAG TPA: hypothetical protein VLZ06_00220 [Solirubrobacteraceae bacterium]|nr:hypothetical protein [Solirubrobacteraceae bacterium]